MADSAKRILVTGASGFIGRRLAPALVEEGYDVRSMTRRPESYSGAGTPVFGDVGDPGSLAEALTDIDVAFYLVHSLDSHDFEERDAAAARAFGTAAGALGVRQIIYLGGLGDEDEKLSAHLRSRREVEKLLGEGGVPVTVLRAAIIVGHGGISWEITRQLVKNLPAMIVPKWAKTRTQPIALDDVVRYLAGVIDHPDALGRIFEVGGDEQMSYIDMLREAALIERGTSVPIVPVPVLTPKLSSYWLSLVTDVDLTTGRNLIDSMNNEVIVRDSSIRDVVPGSTLSYSEAVRRALADRRVEAAGGDADQEAARRKD
ncbi:NAD(P)H-binding protein [Nocardioides pacificus]